MITGHLGLNLDSFALVERDVCSKGEIGSKNHNTFI